MNYEKKRSTNPKKKYFWSRSGSKILEQFSTCYIHAETENSSWYSKGETEPINLVRSDRPWESESPLFETLAEAVRWKHAQLEARVDRTRDNYHAATEALAAFGVICGYLRE